MILQPVAHIENDFPSKFGLPRQSGLNPHLISRVVFEREYSNADFIKGITGFSHLWLIWRFDVPETHSATVRPPRLGGNERRGVFATRSPFRPNPLGLTVVRLEQVHTENSPIFLTVSGADMKDGTVIYDIKPYIPYADRIDGAIGSFAEEHAADRLEVIFPEVFASAFSPEKLKVLTETLSEDPRPAYQSDSDRIYGFPYAGRDVRFTVRDGILTVVQVV